MGKINKPDHVELKVKFPNRAQVVPHDIRAKSLTPYGIFKRLEENTGTSVPSYLAGGDSFNSGEWKFFRDVRAVQSYVFRVCWNEKKKELCNLRC